MKISTLYACTMLCLFFASCGDDESTEVKKENIFKNRPQQASHFQNTDATANATATPQVVAVPFDFGLSAVLGAGALAAVRLAYRRKQQEELEA